MENTTPTNWKVKYQKEHDRKKKLNKQKKKIYKKVKRLTKANKILKAKLIDVKSQRFLKEHNYF